MSSLTMTERARLWHEELLRPQNERYRTFLMTRRGLSPQTIEQYSVGFSPEKQAFTIPIYDRDGDIVVTIKYFRYDLQTGEKSVWNEGSTHLFGLHLLRREYDRYGRVVIVEGELDAMVGNQNGFLVVTGTGGAATWKKEWSEYFRGLNVVICYDSDDAGRRGAQRVARALAGIAAKVTIVTLFGDDASKDRKDVTDFFVKAGKTAEDFRALIDGAPVTVTQEAVVEDSGAESPEKHGQATEEFKEQSKQDLRGEILGLSESSKPEAKRNEIAAKSLELLLEGGRFLKDPDGVIRFFSGALHKVFPLESVEFTDYVSLQTGVNPASTDFRYIMGLVQVQGRQTVEVVNIYRFSYFAEERYTLYLNNSPQTYYTITPTGIEKRNNGDDGIYFVSDPRAEQFTVDLSIGIQAQRLIKRILVESVNFDDAERSLLTKEEQRFLYWTTILSLPLSANNRTKSILVFIGEAGSGKTTALRMLGVALFGERFEVLSPASEEKDIVAAVSRRFLVVLDNIDQRSPFLDDLLARMATGIAFARRKLYTDNDEVVILPKAHLGITSRQPQFNREDIADRLLIFKVRRFEGASFEDEGAIIARIMANRNVLMTGLMLSLQKAVANLKRRDPRFKRTTFRMASTGLLLVKIADKPMKLKGVLEKMSKEQTQFAGEGHPLTELICRWLQEEPRKSQAWFTTASLFFELQEFSREHKLRFYHNSVRSLGMALVNQRRQLDLKLKIERDERKTNNVKRYKFTLLYEEPTDNILGLPDPTPAEP